MEIRDNRQKEWFWLDNEYLNGYARLLGSSCTVVYISLCRHADNKTQTCFPSMKLIAEENAISTRTVVRAVAILQEWGIISIEKSKKNDGTQANNIYTLLAKSNWKSKPSDIKSHGNRVTENDEPSDNNDINRVTPGTYNNTHINNTQLTRLEESEAIAPQYIADGIKLFEGVNKACSKFYANKTQREAMKNLIEAYGVDKVSSVISVLPRLNTLIFNKATTPLELLNKWAKIEAEAIQLKQKKSNNKYEVETINYYD